jgi:hypothetical protein
LTKDGVIVHIDYVDRRQGLFSVYNFEVSTAHTYYVSRLGLLVHNDCGDTLKPGPFADESVPARGPGRPNAAEQAEINRIGSETGCHTCGTKDPGTKSGNFVFDHQPPSAFNPPSQEGYPHCLSCSRRQAGQVTNAKRP